MPLSDILNDLRRAVPAYRDWADDDLYYGFVQDPGAFKRAFPSFGAWNDADIVRGLQKYAETPAQIAAAARATLKYAEVEQPAERLLGQPYRVNPFLRESWDVLHKPIPDLAAAIAGEPLLVEPALRAVEARLPEPGQQGLAGIPKQAVGAMGRAATGLLRYASSPIGAASMGVAAAFPPAAPWIFGAQVWPQVPEAALTTLRGAGYAAGLTETPVAPKDVESAALTGAMGALIGRGVKAAESPRYTAWRDFFEFEQSFTPEHAARAAALQVLKDPDWPPVRVAPPQGPPQPQAAPPLQGTPPLASPPPPQPTTPPSSTMPLQDLIDAWTRRQVGATERPEVSVPRALPAPPAQSLLAEGARTPPPEPTFPEVSPRALMAVDTPVGALPASVYSSTGLGSRPQQPAEGGPTPSLPPREEAPPGEEPHPLRVADVPPLSQGDLLWRQRVFGSPSVQWPKVSPTAGQIPIETARRVNRVFTSVEDNVREMRKRWGPLTIPERRQVIKLLDVPTPFNVQSLPGVTPRMAEAYTWTRGYLDSAFERINAARKEAGEAPLKGISGYWPHIFPGEWMIRHLDETKPMQGPAGQPLVFTTYGDALDTLRTVRATTPDAVLALRQMFAQDPRFSGRVFADTIISLDPNGTPVELPLSRRGRPRPAQPTFVHPREANAPGWLNSPQALETYISGVERYIEMTPWRAQVRAMIAPDGPVWREAPNAPVLRGDIGNYVERVIEGKPSDMAVALHGLWQDVQRTTAESGPVGLWLSKHLPERPGASAVRGVMLAESMTKLGLSVSAALANLTQTFTHTLPIAGPKWTLQAIKELALHSSRYDRLFEKLGLETPSRSEAMWGAGKPVLYRPKLAREALEMGEHLLTYPVMLMFRKPEGFNRSVAAIAGYQSAKARGLSEAQALASAQRLIQRTQFQYGIADEPALLRGTSLRMPFQFKTFMFKTMEMVLNMNKAEAARFLLTSTPLLGARGSMAYGPIVWILSQMLSEPDKPVTTDDIEVFMRNLPHASELLKEGHPVAQKVAGTPGLRDLVQLAEKHPHITRTLTGGAAAEGGELLGVPGGFDVARTAGFQEFLTPPSPRSPVDLLGPGISDIYRGARAIPGAVKEAWTGETLTRNEERDLADFLATSIAITRRIQQATASEKGIVDPRLKRVLVPQATTAERAGMLAGFMPRRLADVYAIRRRADVLEQTRADIKGGYQDAIVQALIEKIERRAAGDQVGAEEAMKRARYLYQEAAGRKIYITRRNLQDGLLAQRRSRLMQTVREAPKILQRDIEHLIPEDIPLQ